MVTALKEITRDLLEAEPTSPSDLTTPVPSPGFFSLASPTLGSRGISVRISPTVFCFLSYNHPLSVSILQGPVIG